jgi:hypothetical protein
VGATGINQPTHILRKNERTTFSFNKINAFHEIWLKRKLKPIVDTIGSGDQTALYTVSVHVEGEHQVF